MKPFSEESRIDPCVCVVSSTTTISNPFTESVSTTRIVSPGSMKNVLFPGVGKFE
jgi:hypothetical protein